MPKVQHAFNNQGASIQNTDECKKRNHDLNYYVIVKCLSLKLNTLTKCLLLIKLFIKGFHESVTAQLTEMGCGLYTNSEVCRMQQTGITVIGRSRLEKEFDQNSFTPTD